MAHIKPFRAVFYSPAKVKDLSKVVTPPYDVISPQGQESFYRAGPHNVVRLVLGKTSDRDGPTDNRYTRAARDMDTWLREKILTRDDADALYIYEQHYPIREGAVCRRVGFVCVVRLEDFSSGGVLPHEITLTGPKVDRLDLLRATRANLCQVFGLYSDPDDVIGCLLRAQVCRIRTPMIDVTADGVRSLVWRLTNPDVIQRVARLMEGKAIFIADGHHRYETALNYRNEMRAAEPESNEERPVDYLMMLLVNMDGEGVTVLPTHRLLKKKPLDPGRIMSGLSEFFNIETCSPAEVIDVMRERATRGHVFGMYLGGGTVHLLSLRDREVIAPLMRGHIPEWQELDVAILHAVIISHVLGENDARLKDSDRIAFTPDENEAFRLVDSGEWDLVFFLNHTTVDQLRSVAGQGEKMPQKSTYFYPKPLTGLLINCLD